MYISEAIVILLMLSRTFEVFKQQIRPQLIVIASDLCGGERERSYVYNPF